MASVSAGTIKNTLSGLVPVLTDMKGAVKSGASALLSGMRNATDSVGNVLKSEGFQTTAESLLGKAKTLSSKGKEVISEFASGPGKEGLATIRDLAKEGPAAKIFGNLKNVEGGFGTFKDGLLKSIGTNEGEFTAMGNTLNFVRGFGQQAVHGESELLTKLATSTDKTSFLKGFGRILGLPTLAATATGAVVSGTSAFAETGNVGQALGAAGAGGSSGLLKGVFGTAAGIGQFVTGATAEATGTSQTQAAAVVDSASDKAQDMMGSIMNTIGENPHLALLAGGIAASVAGGNGIIGTLGRLTTIAGAVMTFFDLGNKEGGITDALKGFAGMGKDEVADAEKGQETKAHTVGQARNSGQLGASEDVQADVNELAAQGLQV